MGTCSVKCMFAPIIFSDKKKSGGKKQGQFIIITIINNNIIIIVIIVMLLDERNLEGSPTSDTTCQIVREVHTGQTCFASSTAREESNRVLFFLASFCETRGCLIDLPPPFRCVGCFCFSADGN